MARLWPLLLLCGYGVLCVCQQVLYSNSIANGEKQKVPATVIDWRIYPKCNLHVSSLLYDSVETLVNDSTSSVSNNWKLGLKLPVDPSLSVSLGVGFGGSHSKETKFAIEKSKKDRYTFFSHSVDCRFYGYRLENKPPLSRAFQSAVNSNPSYHELIDTYEVVGGDNIDADVLFNDQSNPSVYNRWVDSLKSTPDVIKYNLKPLHTILPENHPARAGLKQEVEKYIKNNAVLSQCSET
ncbi:Perforin-1, partial [Dissostichus eleginoides]